MEFIIDYTTSDDEFEKVKCSVAVQLTFKRRIQLVMLNAS